MCAEMVGNPRFSLQPAQCCHSASLLPRKCMRRVSACPLTPPPIRRQKPALKAGFLLPEIACCCGISRGFAGATRVRNTAGMWPGSPPFSSLFSESHPPWLRSSIELFCSELSLYPRVVYQGELKPGKFLRATLPLPAGGLQGKIRLKATFCYASPTDPQDAVAYTRRRWCPSSRR